MLGAEDRDSEGDGLGLVVGSVDGDKKTVLMMESDWVELMEMSLVHPKELQLQPEMRMAKQRFCCW